MNHLNDGVLSKILKL